MDEIGSCLAVLALIFGLLKARISFFVAAGCAGLSAFLLMMYVLFLYPVVPSLICWRSGAALWTAVIAKDAWLKNVKVQHGDALGIYVTPGPALCTSGVFVKLLLTQHRSYLGRVRPRDSRRPTLRGFLLHLPKQMRRPLRLHFVFSSHLCGTFSGRTFTGIYVSEMLYPCNLHHHWREIGSALE